MAETQQMTFMANGVAYTEYRPVLFLSEPGFPGDGVWLSGYALVRGVAISPAGVPSFLVRRESAETVRRWGRITAWLYMAVYLRMIEVREMMRRWTLARKR